MARALVTGATGFIGSHLVRDLTRRGCEVTCLVRKSSSLSSLNEYRPRFVIGDIMDIDAVQQAMEGADIVYNLAGVTKALRESDFVEPNVTGARNVAACCSKAPNDPVLVHVSSLAAAGPSTCQRPRVETDAADPVSRYGKSKRAGELAVIEFASKIPISIVRPPIVLGEGDRDGFEMFKGIANWGVHLAPSLDDDRVSVIHADDLSNALIQVGMRGRRVTQSPDDSAGIYFASSGEDPTYAELGRMIGKALGRDHTWVVHAPKSAVWGIAAINELVSQACRRPHILNLDKAREATAGSWTCSSDALQHDVGFAADRPLFQRLVQTGEWYREQGWLSGQRQRRPAFESRHTSVS
ncbi:NAD-dependent epimerase/dehydratase family protein [Rubripirellula amarantea]|nr:NAD-dependent epimerase/dehydratase family protein [Rubripirellula amarantea]